MLLQGPQNMLTTRSSVLHSSSFLSTQAVFTAVTNTVGNVRNNGEKLQRCRDNETTSWKEGGRETWRIISSEEGQINQNNLKDNYIFHMNLFVRVWAKWWPEFNIQEQGQKVFQSLTVNHYFRFSFTKETRSCSKVQTCDLFSKAHFQEHQAAERRSQGPTCFSICFNLLFQLTYWAGWSLLQVLSGLMLLPVRNRI